MTKYNETLPLVATLKPKRHMKVNLDALILREDLEVKEPTSHNPISIDKIAITSLREGELFYSTLKKPDFQRETSEWTPDRVFDLINSFLNEDLIPAIILWRGEGNNFVIDGAHRLSALIAWVLDDYGDGVKSKAFFDYNMPTEQLNLAVKTRNLINKNIGSYADHVWAVNNPDKAKPDMLVRARKLSSIPIQLQWVPGNASKAEISFFKINEEATPINDTEKELLKSRKKPNAIAARAIIHAGTGHKYWDNFDNPIPAAIEKLAKELNEMLFEPELKSPIKTIELPIAGKSYSGQALELIFNLVNLSNNVKIEGKKAHLDPSHPTVDATGEKTIEFLENTNEIVNRITGDSISSLGLSPIVYFYSLGGRHQITAFMAIVELIKDFERQGKEAFFQFTLIRKDFESFLIKYKDFVNQMTLQVGSGVKSFKRLYRLFMLIISSLKDNKTESEILEIIKADKEFNFLRPDGTELKETRRKEFSTDNKSAIYIKEALSRPQLCKLCGGHIYSKSLNSDHVQDIKNDGLGNYQNGQITHYYCNSIKDKLLARINNVK